MLIGHLGDDVKMHYFDGGNCIGRFPFATSESYTSKQTGEKITTTEWHNIVVRNKAAEICEKYLKKEIKYMLKDELNQDNGKLKMELQNIQQKFKYRIYFFNTKK